MNLKLNTPIGNECRHILAQEGPRIPLVYGSSPTQVCVECGAWRMTLHTIGPWRPSTELEEALRDDEDGRGT